MADNYFWFSNSFLAALQVSAEHSVVMSSAHPAQVMLKAFLLMCCVSDVSAEELINGKLGALLVV